MGSASAMADQPTAASDEFVRLCQGCQLSSLARVISRLDEIENLQVVNETATTRRDPTVSVLEITMKSPYFLAVLGKKATSSAVIISIQVISLFCCGQLLNVYQMGKSVAVALKNESAYFTGGGTLNSYLMSRISFYSSSKIFIPNRKIINFKDILYIYVF